MPPGAFKAGIQKILGHYNEAKEGEVGNATKMLQQDGPFSDTPKSRKRETRCSTGATQTKLGIFRKD